MFYGLFFNLFPVLPSFYWRKGHFYFFLYLISYCLALSFSESTSRRSRRATQNYWELTTLSLSLDLLVLVVFFLICFCRRHAKRAKHQILSEWGFLSVKGGLFSIRFFVFVFVKSWLQVLTNQCCFVRHSFTTGLSWWNDFHFLFSVDFSSNLLRQNIYTFGLLNSSSVSFVLVFFFCFI